MFIMNGHVQLAKDVEADGVHLGGDGHEGPRQATRALRRCLGDSTFVTIAAHSDQAVKLGARDGANGALVSAIFASPGKAAGRGVERAANGARRSRQKDLAIYALGGVERAVTPR